jgi:hypothetical protein
MPEIFDTSSVPDDAPYWDSLAARVTTHSTRRVGGLDWLGGTHAALLAASLVVAALLPLLYFTRGGASAKDIARLEMSIVPRDVDGHAFAVRDSPPELVSLLVRNEMNGVRR